MTGATQPVAAPRRAGSRLFLCAFLLSLFALFAALPSSALAFDLFTRREVTVHFASPQAKPMANAAVRVFAPGNAEKPLLLGRTDGKGNFSFSADRRGFWTVEVASGAEIARVMVRVDGGASRRGFFAPRFFLRGLVVLLLVIALGYRLLLWRRRR